MYNLLEKLCSVISFRLVIALKPRRDDEVNAESGILQEKRELTFHSSWMAAQEDKAEHTLAGALQQLPVLRADFNFRLPAALI